MGAHVVQDGPDVNEAIERARRMNSGAVMLDRLDRAQLEVRARHRSLSDPADQDRIGKYLDVLYRISTCADGCRGGDHMFENLSGRAFNLSYAAYDLLQIGLYDEALAQLRSLGELVNLASLYVFDKGAFNEWIEATHEQRVRKFGPAHVRKLIASANGVLIVNSDLYRHLSESATHITPQTAPNAHSTSGRNHVGGYVQADGYARGVELLQHLLFFACTGFSTFVGRGGLVGEVPPPPSISD
jgi:hypothetical protein